MVLERGIVTPLVLGFGVPELLIILAVVLLLFSGTRLAGLGKSTGRALREFKEETQGLMSEGSQPQPSNPAPGTRAPAVTEYKPLPQASASSQPPSGIYQQPPRAGQGPSGTDLRSDA